MMQQSHLATPQSSQQMQLDPPAPHQLLAQQALAPFLQVALDLSPLAALSHLVLFHLVAPSPTALCPLVAPFPLVPFPHLAHPQVFLLVCLLACLLACLLPQEQQDLSFPLAALAPFPLAALDLCPLAL